PAKTRSRPRAGSAATARHPFDTRNPDMANDGTTDNATGAGGGAAAQYAPEELGAGRAANGNGRDVNLELVLDVPVTVSLRVGSTTMPIRELVKLVQGSVLALDRQADEP